MSKALKYAIAYGMWFVDLGLTAWLFIVSRTALITFLALFYEQGDFQYKKTAETVDNFFTLLLGIGWLGFIITTEGYFRAGALKGSLMNRFARVTGPVLLCIFALDLMLLWLQGIGSDDWLRWLILSAELIFGLLLVMYSRGTRHERGKLRPESEAGS